MKVQFEDERTFPKSQIKNVWNLDEIETKEPVISYRTDHVVTNDLDQREPNKYNVNSVREEEAKEAS